MTSRADLFREYARVIDMCEGTEVNPLSCVKMDGLIFKQDGYVSCPSFVKGNNYSFALAIVEGKPVFSGEKLYDGEKQVIICGSFKDGILFQINGASCDARNLSFNPQKRKTIQVELFIEDAEYWNSMNIEQKDLAGYSKEYAIASMNFYNAIRNAIGSK